MGSLGSGVKEFKKGLNEDDEAEKKDKASGPAATAGKE
jgi:Sec-independent protein translocase protein TatA